MVISRRTLIRRLGSGVVAGAALPSLYGRAGAASGSDDGSRVITRTGPVRLHKNENPYGPSPRVARALRESSLEVTARYPETLEQALREKLAALHVVAPDQIVLGCGSAEILRLAATAFLGPRRKLLLAQPTFELIAHCARQTGAEIAAVPLCANHAHDLAAMLSLADGGTGLVYICNPNNPTGSLTNRRDLESFLARLPAATHVVVDEAYHHYVGGAPEYASFLDAPVVDERLIVTRSFSGVYGLAGARVGYAVAAAPTARLLERGRLADDVNGPAALAAITALDDQEHVRSSARRNMDERQEFCNQANARMLRTIDSHANFVMLNTGRPAAEIIAHFRANGVLVGGPYDGFQKHVRVSVGTPAEMREFWRVWDLLPANHTMVM
jgi:histidinol-phosphate aminotransferase